MSKTDMPVATMDAGAAGQSMPSSQMSASQGLPQAIPTSTGTETAHGEMPVGVMDSGPTTAGGGQDVRVLVELRAAASTTRAMADVAGALPGLAFDSTFDPVPMKASPTASGTRSPGSEADAPTEATIIVRGFVDPAQIEALKADPNVVAVWSDGRIEPFGAVLDVEPASVPDADTDTERPLPPPTQLLEGMAVCPIGTCDCAPGTPKGTIGDVAAYLGVNAIWAAGKRGDGIVVGVVDGGIRGNGRPIKAAEAGRPTLGRVIGGFPAADWGTTAAAWSDHGMMCGTDVLGMAPNAQLYDLRISGAASNDATLSVALSAFQWAIDRHQADGTPHVLSNSWGMFQKSWAPDYTTNPNHPFTRKVIEAIDEGILVLFAAGNCGGTCPDGRCGPDSGPGKSIWGANGHPRVMTVGAVNKNEQFVGYSSQGPAALDPNKPDFCSVTHFTGFFTSDSGTSAATPIAAGVVALLKQTRPSLSQDQVKAVLKSTAKDIGPGGFDQHAGSGIIRAGAAFAAVNVPATWKGWESLGGFCTDGVGVSSWAPGRLDTFVVGNDRHLYHKWFNGSWSGWEDLGGNLYSNPTAVSWGPNRIDVFAIGGDHAMWHRWWDGAAWKGWESLGGFCTDGVGVSSWAPGRLDTFVVGNDRHLYHKWFSGSWSGWEDLGGNLYSNPAAVSWISNRIDVFAIGGDHAMWHRWYD